VANYYHELAEDDSVVGVSYEQSWSGELEHALRASFDDDRFRGHTTIGPQRDDIALTRWTVATLGDKPPRVSNVRSPSRYASRGTSWYRVDEASIHSCYWTTCSANSTRTEVTGC
jgi:hypothetical protein